MDYTDIGKTSGDDILKQLRDEKKITCLIPYTSRESDVYLSRMLRLTLEEINQVHLHPHLEYVLNELATNASKGNSKRLYFKDLGLNIADSKDYEKGMAAFKADVFTDFSPFIQKHLDNESFVEIILDISSNSLNIEVLSPNLLNEQEKQRIADRIESAKKFENLTEVLTHGFDSTEGAGFGLIIVLLMLRKVNLDERSLVFDNRDGSSITSLKVPINLLSPEQSELIAVTIAEELKKMPQFPENIRNLQRELSNPDCTFNSIAETVKEDVVLAAEIIRISNSPAFRGKQKITDVTTAIRMIGMLGVRSILYNYGVNKVFQNRYDKKLLKELNQHSFFVALIGSFIARYKKIGKIAEEIFVAGLLHDMGKIIVSSIDRNLEQKLEELCKDKHIPIAILDDLTDGFNHSLIGSEVAKNWDFPEKFIEAIRYHHLPLEANESFRAITYAVYLGNEIYYYERGERDFNELNHIVLSFFGLEKKESFQELLDQLKLEGFGF